VAPLGQRISIDEPPPEGERRVRTEARADSAAIGVLPEAQTPPLKCDRAAD